jgi:hypothetical protein
MMHTNHFASLEKGLNGILESLEGDLSPAEQKEVQDFVDAGEYGVALETLVAIFAEENKKIGRVLERQIQELAAAMRLSIVVPPELLEAHDRS